MSSKIFDRVLHRTFTFDFHEFISLLSIGFLILHIVILTGDQYMPYSIAQILIPFISPYRPVWVGVGVISFYLILLVSVTFYIRSRITMKAFRVIHWASFIAYITAAAHSIFSGTDSPLAMSELMYVGTFLVIVFMTAYWLLTLRSQKGAQTSRGYYLSGAAQPTDQSTRTHTVTASTRTPPTRKLDAPSGRR
ncbi:MAG: ferric reductase-like transmembrane domain-containing protein [Chloroflexi bacterium]|nr:ferric reductase-like transmembrane domain-containing protein [Chloroflexota bacterium]MCL5273410.1 ferric reductase-like transmembrane domain-containing protein [Chloroflexota bacterium]